MAHHAHGFRIFPDDEPSHSIEGWARADSWVNGMQFKKDFNEACALAKRGALCCQFPFVVHLIPLGGERPKETDVWIFNNKKEKP